MNQIGPTNAWMLPKESEYVSSSQFPETKSDR